MVNFRRSLVINFFASTGTTIIQFIVSLLLARILSPSEIGVFSMTVVFINIAHIFRDFGVGSYLQREAELTPEKIRAAMGVLYTSSWFLAAVIFFASGWVAEWFKEPAIGPVMKVLALGFLFIPLGSITHALLTREFASDKQAFAGIASTLAYAATCLSLGSLGFGTMSLAWANLANILVGAIALIPFRPKGMPWLPSFKRWRGVLHFGLGSLASNCANAVNEAIPDILLGKLGGARQVGLLSRANSTVAIFGYVAGSTVNYGAISYISQAHHRGELLTPLLNRAVALLTGVGWPMLGVTAVLGHEIILALYGQKWLESVPAIPALAITGAIGLLFNYTPTALLALGKPYLSAIPTAVTILSRVAFGILLFDGSLLSFSWAICIATIAAVPVMLVQHHHYLGYTATSMAKAVMPSAITTLFCMAAAALLKLVMPSSVPVLVNLCWITIPITIVWYSTLRLTRHPLVNEVHHFAGSIKAKIFKRPAAK
jgi:O-antigen/teichoic acid export membrane protein